jgi:hypothetical protein
MVFPCSKVISLAISFRFSLIRAWYLNITCCRASGDVLDHAWKTKQATDVKNYYSKYYLQKNSYLSITIWWMVKMKVKKMKTSTYRKSCTSCLDSPLHFLLGRLGNFGDNLIVGRVWNGTMSYFRFPVCSKK